MLGRESRIELAGMVEVHAEGVCNWGRWNKRIWETRRKNRGRAGCDAVERERRGGGRS